MLYPSGAVALCLLTALTALPAAAQSDAARSDEAGRSAGPAVRPPATPAEARTAAYLESVRNDPGRLGDFFRKLPKGGDLHNHLSGAVTTEYLIELAAQDGLCIETKTMTAVQPPCKDGARPAADARSDKAFHKELVRAWSMEDFPQGESGHDHFFAAFGKFGEVTWRHPGKLLAEVAEDAARQNQSYLETMATPASDGAKKLAEQVGWDPDPARMHRKLLADGKLDRPGGAGPEGRRPYKRRVPHRGTLRHRTPPPAGPAGCPSDDGSRRSPAGVHPSASSPRSHSACGWPSATRGSSPSTSSSPKTGRVRCATTGFRCGC